MKRFFFIIVGAFFIIQLHAQSIKINETDKATGKKKIETDYTTLLNIYPTYLYAKFKTSDTSYILELRGGDVAVAVIQANDKVIIKLADSSEVTGFSIAKQNFTVDDNAKYYTHEYAIGRPGIEALSRQKAVWIRKYSGSMFQDIIIPQTYQDNLKSLSILLLKTL